MPALGSAGRFVGEGAAALVTIARDVVRGRLQCTTVKRAGDPVRAVRATVDQRLEMHSSNRAILLDAGFEFHQDGVPPPVAIKDLFTRQANLDRPVQHERRTFHATFAFEDRAEGMSAFADKRKPSWKHR